MTTADKKVLRAWAKEIERRAEALDRGEAKTIPWSKVDAELGRRLRRIRKRRR